LAIIHSLRDGSDSVRDALGQWTSAVGVASTQFVRTWAERVQVLHRTMLWALLLVLAIGVTSLILLISDRWPYGRGTKRPTARTQQQIVHMYRKMLELSARRGIRITPSTTPTEASRLVSERWEAAESTVVRLTTLYCRARFGVGSLSSEELTQAVKDLAVLKRLVRTRE
jgi:uncharacterized protein DUF4129